MQRKKEREKRVQEISTYVIVKVAAKRVVLNCERRETERHRQTEGERERERRQHVHDKHRNPPKKSTAHR